MPIDIESVRGAELPELTASWSANEVILYHLALGAGDPPTSERELAYTYERDLVVLPSYGVVPPMRALFAMLEVPGLDVELTHLLHGEQELEVHEQIPVEAQTRTEGRIAEVFDKGRNALVVLETTTFLEPEGRPLFTNRWGGILIGEGGFGGESGPPPRTDAPADEPDHRVTVKTLPQQALLYRLTGDSNPLHADPEVARGAGFERPILHGLCTYGVACKAVVDTVLDGDPARVGSYATRFAGPLVPGESLEISMWERDAEVLLDARCPERDAPVLSRAAIALR